MESQNNSNAPQGAPQGSVATIEPKLVVFGWSGVLVDDLWANQQAHMRVITGVIQRLDDIQGIMAFKNEPHVNAWAYFTNRYLGDQSSLGPKQKQEMQQVLEGWITAHMTQYGALVEESGIRCYADALSVLQYLKGKEKSTAVLSGHPQALLEKEAARNEITGYLSAIIGDSRDKSLGLLDLCSRFSVVPKDCLFVGDTKPDMIAARDAGVMSAAHLQGYHENRLLEEKPDYVLKGLNDLIRIIK